MALPEGVCEVPCDRMPRGRRFRPHCHVEGCDWPQPCPRDTDGDGNCGDRMCDPVHTGCGLLKIAPETSLSAAYDIGCAVIRREVHR